MKRQIASVALAISLTIPSYGWGAEVLLKGFLAPKDGIFFTEPDANRLLQEVERCQILKEELATRVDLEVSLRNEIREMEKREAECTKAIDAAKKGGSLWERVKTAGKWVFVGVVVGFVASSAR